MGDSGLNMTTSREMRELAHRLLAYEAVAGKASEPAESATLRVYEKLRQSLVAFAGIAAFQSLALRALTQAKSEVPSLWAAQVAEDGSLQGLGEIEPEVELDRDQAGEYSTGEGGITLIARLLGLLHIFLGGTLTLNLLRNAWPSTNFDDRSLENGRES
jgi:hypothetical protein